MSAFPDLMISQVAGGVRVPVFTSQEDWERRLECERSVYDARWRMEREFKALVRTQCWVGWCGLCGEASEYLVARQDEPDSINLREELICTRCGINARVRVALELIRNRMDLRTSDVYLTEQASRPFVWLQRNARFAIGSEYVRGQDSEHKLQQYFHDLGGKGDIRVEDVTGLTFGNGSLDCVASFDVLEHVPDYRAALSEFARVLRPGGMLVVTVPFVFSYATTLVRARLDGSGGVDHLVTPEYHGDPVDGAGILCFYHFGWDLLEVVRECGFLHAGMALPWHPGMGMMDHLWTLVAFK